MKIVPRIKSLLIKAVNHGYLTIHAVCSESFCSPTLDLGRGGMQYCSIYFSLFYKENKD